MTISEQYERERKKREKILQRKAEAQDRYDEYLRKKPKKVQQYVDSALSSLQGAHFFNDAFVTKSLLKDIEHSLRKEYSDIRSDYSFYLAGFYYAQVWKIFMVAWARLDELCVKHLADSDSGSWFRHRMFVLMGSVYLFHRGAIDSKEYDSLMSKWERPPRNYRDLESDTGYSDIVEEIEKQIFKIMKESNNFHGKYNYADTVLKANLTNYQKDFPKMIDVYTKPSSGGVEKAARTMLKSVVGKKWEKASWAEQQEYLDIAHRSLTAALCD